MAIATWTGGHTGGGTAMDMGTSQREDVIKRLIAKGMTRAAAEAKIAANLKAKSTPDGAPKRLDSVKDVAARLGVTKVTVVRWVGSGKVPPPDYVVGTGPGAVWAWDPDKAS